MRFFIETVGCLHNFADSQRMAGLLREAKFEQVIGLEDADIVVLNTCTLKGPIVDDFFIKLEKLKEDYPYKSVVVAGCIPKSGSKRLKDFSVVGPRNLHKIVEVVEETINENIAKCLEKGEIPPLDLPHVRKNCVVEIIPINIGCLSACSFCKSKHSRGNLTSYGVEEIVTVAKKAVDEGVKEIWLTSQDIFCYGFDIQTNVAKLLSELLKIEGDFKIKLGTGNPVHLVKFIDELIPLLNHEKMFNFCHLPIQSGSNKVLNDMKRGGTCEEFVDLVKKLKDGVKNITIATDVIVGYPSETAEDFWDTQKIIRQVNPGIINISRFCPRPGTSAGSLDPIDDKEVDRRRRVITDIYHNIALLQNERWLGWKGQIVISAKCKDEGQFIGRNDSYKPIIVSGDYKFGDKIRVEVTKINAFDLRGKQISPDKEKVTIGIYR
jgi:threonylcarbamoyladenosine tRNA methylthiotransferase CDKAL1